MALKISEVISITNTMVPSRKRNCSLFFIPKPLKNSNNLIKIKFVSIRSGLTRTDINGKIEATPITSINAITKIINNKSPTAMRMLKFGFNLLDDGLVGQQLFAGEATRLAYATPEAQEGRDAFLEKREQDYTKFPWHF